MTFRIERGSVSDGGLVAVSEVLTRVKDIESADKIAIDIKLSASKRSETISHHVLSWKNGDANIPNLSFTGKVRPQFLLNAIKISEPNWPTRIVLKLDLSGNNCGLNYATELLEFAKTCCVRRYTLESVSKIRFEGRSYDLGRTPYFVQLSTEHGMYVITGVPVAPRRLKSHEEVGRSGW